MGGDEFCVLVAAPADARRARSSRAAARCASAASSFAIGSSYGVVTLLDDGARRRPSAAHRRPADVREQARRPRAPPTSRPPRCCCASPPSTTASCATTSTTSPTWPSAVGRELGLDAARRSTEVRRAAALHDIGKIAIPDAILHAPRPLDRRRVGVHAPAHDRSASASSAPRPSCAGSPRIVRSSHERYDGAGYPDGLAGETIPLGARIVAVCDAYDAMTSPTAPTARALPADEALDELARCAGTPVRPARRRGLPRRASGRPRESTP